MNPSERVRDHVGVWVGHDPIQLNFPLCIAQAWTNNF